MKKYIVAAATILAVTGLAAGTSWKGDFWEDDMEMNWSQESSHKEFVSIEEPEPPEKPNISIEEPEKPDFICEKPGDKENETQEPSGQLEFRDQALSENSTVVVENLSAEQPSTTIITYEEDGELIIAGLAQVEENESGNIEVSIEDAGGFPGEHTAHLVPTEDLSGDYEIGDRVSETTASNILDSETANVTESAPEPVGELSFEDQNLSENSTVSVEDITAEQESTLILTYPNEGRLTVAGLESVDDLENQDVEIEVENADGFPGNHTAHIVPDEGLSSEYSISDNVSEQTASNILDSETALVQ